jgi:predicted DNA binding CopG/RHH family protein
VSKLKTITIRLDDELHKEIKVKMATEGTTIQDYIINLVKKDLEPSKSKK